MKKIFILVLLALLVTNLISQTPTKKSAPADTSKKTQSVANVVYQLFPTQNMWVFLKLNTKTGQMWQVQYDLDGETRSVSFLNFVPLVTTDKEVSGRFTLYPTTNTWNFILLDQIDGNTWQVQWSLDPDARFIVPLK